MKCFIYALCCPESGVPRYIGKTGNLNQRLMLHINRARNNQTSSHCSNWIRSLLARGLTPTIQLVSEVPEDADWQQMERDAIVRYREMGFDLTNSTSGGDGLPDLSPEAKAKRLASWQRTMADPETRASFLSTTRAALDTPEVRKKQSDSLKSRWADPDKKVALLNGMNTPEALARKSELAIQRHADPKYAANHSAKSKEIWNRPERKEEARKRSLKAWADPDITKRRKASLLAANSTEAHKNRMREVGREIGSRPEVKAKRSASLKAYAADPVRFAKRLASMGSAETRAKMSASAKARFAKPGSKNYLSTPEHRQKLSEAAKRRATPEYRAMLAERTRLAWIKRKAK